MGEASMMQDDWEEEEEEPVAAVPSEPVLRLSDHYDAGQAFRSVYRLGAIINKPRGSCVRTAHCQHVRTGEKCAVKIFNVKHMDFDEPTIVKEVMRLKEAQER